LKNLSSQFTNYSIIACFIILIILMVMGVVASTAGGASGSGANATEELSTGGLLV
jgi:hypothetical protein